MTDLTRTGTYHQKKTTSYFAGQVEEGADGVAVGAGNYLLANLPSHSLIVNAYVFVETASDAATSMTATLGTASGGTQVLSAGNLKTAGKVGTFTGVSATTTGKELWLNLAKTGAATVNAKFIVVVEYLEYTKRSGELTNIN